MVCRDFILPEPASYVFFYAVFNLRKLLYIIADLDRMIVSMRQNVLAQNSISSYLRVFRTFLHWCAKEGYTTLDVPNYKQVETLKETYTDEELLRLLKKPAPDCNFCEYRNWVIINFLLNSGCRAATVRNILIGDVFLPDSQIIFRHTKTHKVQVVPLAQMNANAERIQKGSSRR